MCIRDRFYMGSVAIMVIAVPWDDPKLGTSPFVAVLDRAGIPAASEVMTLVIVLALLSSLNANLYGAARMLGSLAERGMAPRAAMRTRGRSVPAMAVLASVLFGFCCVLATFWWGDTVLGTLLNIVGSTIIVTYFFTICSQYVLRRQVEREGTPLPMRIKGFPVVSWAAMILLVSIMVLGMFAPDVRAQLLSTGALVVVLYLVGIAWSLHDGRSPFRPTTD